MIDSIRSYLEKRKHRKYVNSKKGLTKIVNEFGESERPIDIVKCLTSDQTFYPLDEEDYLLNETYSERFCIKYLDQEGISEFDIISPALQSVKKLEDNRFYISFDSSQYLSDMRIETKDKDLAEKLTEVAYSLK